MWFVNYILGITLNFISVCLGCQVLWELRQGKAAPFWQWRQKVMMLVKRSLLFVTSWEIKFNSKSCIFTNSSLGIPRRHSAKALKIVSMWSEIKTTHSNFCSIFRKSTRNRSEHILNVKGGVLVKWWTLNLNTVPVPRYPYALGICTLNSSDMFAVYVHERVRIQTLDSEPGCYELVPILL